MTTAARDTESLVERARRIEARRFLADPELPTNFGALAAAATTVARLTVWPWVIRAYWRDASGNLVCGMLKIVASRDKPDAAEHLPEGVVAERVEVYCATRFDEPLDYYERRDLAADYKTFRRWRKARSLGLPVEAMRPWVDYDPVEMDDAVNRWIAAGRSPRARSAR